MNLRALPIVGAVLVTGCVSTGPRELEIKPDTALSTAVAPRVVLDFSAGDIRVVPSEDDQLRASVRFFCNAGSDTCRNNAARSRILHTREEGVSTVSFKPGSAYSTRHADIFYRVEVPAVESLEVTMGAGALTIDSPTGCVSARGTAGDIKIRVPEALVGSVTLDANLGDSNLSTTTGRAEDRRTLLVGSEVEWTEGPGECRVNAKLTAGAIDVILQE